MPQFRKRPVVISAEQFFPDQPPWPEGVQYHEKCEAPGAACSLDGTYYIDTLEGRALHVQPGDWIITGIAGERYPCKADVFAATYDAVPEGPAVGVVYLIPDATPEWGEILDGAVCVTYAEKQTDTYLPLPAVKLRDGRVISQWRVTEEVLQRLQEGANLYLVSHTFHEALQPLQVFVGLSGCLAVPVPDGQAASS